MRESDYLAGKKCGVEGCANLAQHSRSKIALLRAVGVVANVEILFCDAHNALASKEPERFELTQEIEMRETP